MKVLDIRIAAFQEAASICEAEAKRYGPLSAISAEMAARKIRAQMVLEVEDAREPHALL